MRKYLLLPLILTLLLIFSVNCFAVPWDVDTAVYANKSKDVSAQDIYPYDLFFKSDGTKMYIMGKDTGTVYQYTLSAAWDVSTASYANKYKSVISEDFVPLGLFFHPNGTKMYIMGNSFQTVYQYALSVAWDVDTAVYANKSKAVGSEDFMPYDLFFHPDGTRMYIMGAGNATVYQYALSVAWDVSTASYADKYKSVGSEDTMPYDLFFHPDGTKMYILGYNNNTVYQYSPSTAWDVDTAVYANKCKDVGSEELYPIGMVFSPDGTKMYVVGTGTATIYQYSLAAVNILFFATNL